MPDRRSSSHSGLRARRRGDSNLPAPTRPSLRGPKFRVLQWGFLLLGLLLIASWSRNDFASHQFQANEARKLETVVRAKERARTAATREAPRPAKRESPGALAKGLGPGVLGRVEIPRLHIGAIVADGVDDRTLGHAVGHIHATAPPGGNGNCVLAGHRDTFFRGLGDVQRDDVIRIVEPERTWSYRVVWTAVVEPNQVEVLDSTATRSLTLVTCYPFGFLGHAPQRFIVRAIQVEPGKGDASPSHGGLAARGR